MNVPKKMKCNNCNHNIAPVIIRTKKGRVRVICPNSKCGMITGIYSTETDALSAWNRINMIQCT